jgi:hypothetical protein
VRLFNDDIAVHAIFFILLGGHAFTSGDKVSDQPRCKNGHPCVIIAHASLVCSGMNPPANRTSARLAQPIVSGGLASHGGSAKSTPNSSPTTSPQSTPKKKTRQRAKQTGSANKTARKGARSSGPSSSHPVARRLLPDSEPANLPSTTTGSQSIEISKPPRAKKGLTASQDRIQRQARLQKPVVPVRPSIEQTIGLTVSQDNDQSTVRLQQPVVPLRPAMVQPLATAIAEEHKVPQPVLSAAPAPEDLIVIIPIGAREATPEWHGIGRRVDKRPFDVNTINADLSAASMMVGQFAQAQVDLSLLSTVKEPVSKSLVKVTLVHHVASLMFKRRSRGSRFKGPRFDQNLAFNVWRDTSCRSVCLP